jgi:hypothetical protein
MVVLLPMFDNYSNGYTRARSFGTAAKIKIIGEAYGLVLMSYLYGCLQKSTRLRHERKTIMKTSMIC